MPARSPAAYSVIVAVLALVLGAGCDKAVAAGVGAQFIEPALVRVALAESLVVDVRSKEQFDAQHLPGAVHVPPEFLHGYLHRARARGQRPVVLVCETGVLSALAYPSARSEGFEKVHVVEGGLQRWRREGLPLESGSVPEDPDSRIPPRRDLTRAQQLVAFLSGGVIKPTYMLLTLVVAWALRRSKAPSLRLLFHGSLWFFVGEAFCAINYYFHGAGFVQPLDLLHGAGMVAMSTLIPWGLFRIADDRVLHYSDPQQGCLVQRLCGRCWKRDPVRCGPHDLMLLLAGALSVVSLMPLSSDLRPSLVLTEVFGSTVDYGLPIANHLVELRLYPILGSLLLLLAFGLLWGNARSVRRAEPVFFAGFGFMAYSLLRHLLLNTHSGALYWADFWEELTELVLIASVGMILLVFRHQLGLVPSRPGDRKVPVRHEGSPGETE